MVGLVVVLFIALQIPQVQQFAAQKAADFLADKMDTKVEIGGFTTDWRNSAVLKDVYIEDQQGDTLWYSQRLGLDLGIFALLKGQVNINNAKLEHATVKLHIRPDGSTNFDFVAEAFPTDTTAQPLQFNLGTFDFQDVYVNFRDEASGNLVKTRIGQLQTSVEEFDLEKQHYMLDKIQLRNTAINYVQTKLPPKTESEPIAFQFGLNGMDLENVKLNYKNLVADQLIKLDIGKSELAVNNIDLPNARIDLQSFDLHNSNIVYVQDKFKSSDSLAVNPAETAKKLDESVAKTQGKPMNWVLNLEDLNISNTNIQFDNFNAPKQPHGMDYDHLAFQDVEVNAENFRFSQNKMGLKLNQLKLQEQSGFRIEDFQTKIYIDSTSARLADLNLKTGHSHLIKEVALQYPSLETIGENLEKLTLAIDVENSKIGMQDVYYFVPDLAKDPNFRKIGNTTIRIDGQAMGTLANLNLKQLQLSGLSGTNVNVSGNLKNLTDPDKLYLNLDIARLTSTRTDVNGLLPAGTLPPDIKLPATFSMSGHYRGTLSAFDLNANIRSSAGNLVADVTMKPGPKGAEPFTANIRADRLDLKQLLTEDYGLGVVSGNFTASGTGLTPETMVAQVKGQLQEVNYNGYAYKNINLDAKINRNIFDVKATSTDPNLGFDVAGTINLRDSKNPIYDLDLNLKSLNLQALGFYPEDLTIKGNIKTNLKGSTAGTLHGNLEGRNLIIGHNGVKYPVDSLLVTIKQQTKGPQILVASDLMLADMQFGNDLANLPTALLKHFSNYFDLQPDPPYPANTNLGDFAFTVELRKTGLITSFVPGLTTLSPSGPISGNYNSQTKELNMDGSFKQVKYTDYALNNLNFQLRGDKDKIGYTVKVQEIKSPQLSAPNVTISGEARDNNISTRLAVAEKTGVEKFVIGGLLNSAGKGYRFSLNPDQLVINKDKWTVPADNYIQFDTNFLYANNLKLERNEQSVSLNSVGPVAPNAPLQVQFRNFNIGYAMQTFQQQDSLVAGTLNGEATIRNIMTGNLAFTSDLTVTNFAYTGVPVGNLALKANSAGNNRYNLNATLTGNGNQANITGFYEATAKASLLNLDADIASLNLAALEGFTAGAIKEMAGTASGRMKITGTLQNPDINGVLNFSQAQFNVAMLNSLYKLQNEKLVFDDQGIRFNNFTMTDVNNNTAVVNGTIFTQNYSEFRFDLTARAKNFLAMNSTAKDNDLYYGKLLLDANATITGNQVEPQINIRATVLDGSDLVYVVPGAGSGAASSEGIVEFVDFSDSINFRMRKDSSQIAYAGFQGVNVNANVKVTDATQIKVIIDPATGDNLTVRGNGTFLNGISPSGQINLSGRYDITKGRYEMEFYDIASRNLDLTPDSYIVWTGDPLQGDMNITAIYKTRAAPLELIAAETGGLNQTDQNVYRTTMPFEVHVKVEGELIKPELNFDIQLPENQRSAFGGQIETKLMMLRQDEAEMNKQVFSLLVLGRFMAPDPLQSSGGGFSATARNSLSQVMSDQLNRLTGDYAAGLGLEFGVTSYEDYSSGSPEGRTDLNVALRQQFLNNRLTVRVGTDVGLEGRTQTAATTRSNSFGGDISVEYSLTSDGRLRVRAFQRNQYESYLEGDVIATGLGLIFVREYNNFSELFDKAAKRQSKQAKQARKEEENVL